MLTAAAFLVAYSVGCLMALLRHPIYGLVTYVSLIYIFPPARWWSSNIPSFRWSLFSAAITVLAIYIHRNKDTDVDVGSQTVIRGLLILVAWIAIQSFWALDPISHSELLTLMIKYTILVWLIVKCIDSLTHMKYFMWAHATGCFYLGMVVITQYIGGRFEGFEGPGIDDANAAAIQIVTGVLVTFVLFLSGKSWEKVTAFAFMPITLNALIATISRSGFLALGVAGVLFNYLAPRKMKRVIRFFSLAGLTLFVVLANPVYWERILTILEAGEEVENVDTGTGRLMLIGAQIAMFTYYPMGCGHRCTATISPYVLEEEYLSEGEVRARSSHNTFMTLLVEQGIPGGIFYILLLIWTARITFQLRERMRSSSGLLPATYAASVSILGAIAVGDMFVDYLKFETRIWFIALLIATQKLAHKEDLLKSAHEENHPELAPTEKHSRLGQQLPPAR